MPFISKQLANQLSEDSPHSQSKKRSSPKSSSKDKEQSFSILPHPAKSNDPDDLENPQLGAGLNSSPEYQAHHARDPHVPSQAIVNKLDEPLSREELQERSKQLNA